MELVINRRYWGTGAAGGVLLDNNGGKMCCLGFYCRAVGFKKEDIDGHGMPSDLLALDDNVGVSKKLQKLFTKDGLSDNGLSSNLAEVNDSTSTRYNTLPKKEKRITQLFKKIGVRVKFTN